MTAPSASELLFSAKCFAAALAALWIGYAMALPRPFWGFLTVYVVSNPLSGAVRSKAAYRVAGTVLGSVAAVALVPALSPAPELLAPALALWVGACLTVSLLDRTPRGYLFMLAGYTVGLIGFPAVGQPGTMVDVALWRVEEITLGILCATIVHTVVLPRGVGPVFAARLEQTLRDAERWTRDALAGIRGEADAAERQRLARDVTELRVLASHLPYDTTRLRWTAQAVRALQDRMTYLLPLIAAVEDRIDALRATPGGLPPAVAAVLDDLARWIAAGRDDPAGEAEAQAEAERLRAHLAAIAPRIGPGSTGRELLALNLVHRLRAMLDVHRDCRELHDHVRAGRPGLPARLDPLARRRSGTPFHLDHGMALWSGAAAVVAILLVCAFWILTGWPSGSAAAMMVAVFCSFFAAMDDPAPGIRLFLVFTLLSLPAAALYLLLVLPAVNSFEMLAAAMAPAFLALGVFIGRPATTGRAMALTFGIGGALSLHDIGTADFPSFVNSSLGQIMGVATAMVVTQLVRSVGAAWSARRLLRAGWAELADLAGSRRAPEPGRFENRMLDRIGLLSPRLALAGPQEDLAAADAVNDLRIGLNIVDIQRARPLLDGADRCIAALMELLRAHFRVIARHGTAAPSPTLLERIDATVAGLAVTPPSAERERALVALAGLRRSLFPAAPAEGPLALERAA